MSRAGLLALAVRVERAARADNSLDVLVEIALFRPTTTWQSIRANSAGTKVIYTDINGRDGTFRAADWTSPTFKTDTAAALRALAERMTDE